ncbi:hypothetical protein KS4_10040 [Poriferisphaera corsica]|uniref:Uncharacterized protein n=1 Tax=Poriferisphaera corsica TaxID=2528020 RepID=A0A517YRW9_9BACT|nr:hypothetical protein [Poriferisphaera corsica]QDU32965.1 hypothetical protein KS4_10040 [Poriferisphaera corsica]
MLNEQCTGQLAQSKPKIGCESGQIDVVIKRMLNAWLETRKSNGETIQNPSLHEQLVGWLVKKAANKLPRAWHYWQVVAQIFTLIPTT